jgi:hypothetical protein
MIAPIQASQPQGKERCHDVPLQSEDHAEAAAHPAEAPAALEADSEEMEGVMGTLAFAA